MLASSVCFFAVLVCVATAVDPVGPNGGTCGIKNYDISSLHAGRPYWFFNIKDSKNCVEGSAKSCSVFFTFCQTLPDKYCPNKNSGICEEVTPDETDPKPKYYSLGQATTMFDEKDDNNGFMALFGNGSNATEKCPNKSVTTVLSLQCDSKAMWNFNTGDVTEHVVLEALNPGDDCQILFNIKYSGACIKEKPNIEGCNALKHYDLSTIRSDIWKATVPEASCKNTFNPAFAGVMANDTCQLLFSFCEPLDNDICANSIFCQQDAFGKGVSFGSYNEQFQIDSDADYTGFSISAYDGTKNRNCSEGFFSTLRFNCSKTADWSKVSNNDISKYVKAYPGVDECEFVVDLQYDGACSSYRPPKANKTSPFGGILIGIFFGVLILYFAIGAVVQLIRGRRGAEIIPNHAMWTEFFMLVLEGCSFSLDIVTCYRCQSGARAKRSYDYEKL